MSEWVCIPCLLTLRNEFNLVSPKRDKGADGTIGDTAHAAGGSSDHLPDEDFPKLRMKDSDHKNEVHALDIDATGPWPDGKGGQAGGWFDKQIHRIIAEEKRRWLDPNDMCRLRYVIWRGYIYHMDNDFVGVKYTGSSDLHFDHAHFSGRYETRAEEDTRSWGVYVPPAPKDDFMSFVNNQTEFNAAMTAWAKTSEGKAALGAIAYGQQYGSPVYTTRTEGQFHNDLHGIRDVLVGDTKGKDPKFSGVQPTSPLALLLALPAQVAALNKAVTEAITDLKNSAPGA